MPEPLSVIILAGGSSRRMGQDKAWLSFEGLPLIEHVARLVLPLASSIVISTNDRERFEPVADGLRKYVPVAIVSDVHPGAGPLAGLEAGLLAAHTDLSLMLAVDMPFVNRLLVEHLIALAPGYDVVVPVVDAPAAGQPGLEPLHALYRRSCLAAITARLEQGHRRAVSFYPDVRVREVQPDEIRRFDPAYLSFFNVNTPEDWERARALRQDPGSHGQIA